MEKKLTQGSIFKNIIRFSLPFLLSYFLQTLYGMADLFIAGQFNGADVISAVSIGSQIMHMVTVMIVGLAMGGTVLIGQAVGAKDSKKVSSMIGNTVSLFMIVAFIITFVLLLFCEKIINLVQTPSESIEETVRYLKICFMGIPFIVAYNVIAAIYRGLGDSKSPMIFIAIACFINIILDFVFMGAFSLKAQGAAIATVLAQTFSVIISFFYMRQSKNPVKISLSDLKLNAKSAGSILKIGVPVCCQDGFIQISFMIITVIANRRGVDVAAAVGIVEKIICFLFLVPSSMLSTISSIAAQNIGAGLFERARKTLWTGTAIASIIGLFFALIFQFISFPVILLFTNDEVVVELGVQYLKTYVFDCFFAAFHFSFSGYFCALGKSIISFIHNITSILLVRIPGAYLAAKFFPETLTPMGMAAPLGSALSAIICVFAYFIITKKSNYSALKTKTKRRHFCKS